MMTGNTPRPGRAARTLRLPGLDRNPLRRRADRIGAAFALGLLGVFLAAGTGHWAHAAGQQAGQAQAAWRRVPAAAAGPASVRLMAVRLAPASLAPPAGPVAPRRGTAAERVLALINRARARARLQPLKFSAGLYRSASAHSSKMASGCGLSHQCRGEPDLGARETAAGVDWSWAGENIGDGGPMPGNRAAIAQMATALTQGMLDEKAPGDGHRRNILSGAFHHIGIAIRHDSSGTVWMTQDFSN